MVSMLPSVSCSLFLLLIQSVHCIPEITPEEFYEGIQNNRFDAIIDVRATDQWDTGHIVNATSIAGLESQTSVPDALQSINCNDYCREIVVYCNSGVRSAAAIRMLLDNGYNATLVNGLGVKQWTGAGYGLVSTPSIEPLCGSRSSNDTCPPRSAEEVAAAALSSSSGSRQQLGSDGFMNGSYIPFISMVLSITAYFW